MSFAFLPLYTGDYLRDTRHLTPTRHGIYLLLLMHCWDQKGPVPLDEQEAAGIANCRSADEIDALRYVLGRYFVKLEDGHYNKRMSEEVSRAENLSDLRSKAGQKSAKTRAKIRSATRVQHLLNKSSAQVGTPTPTLTPTTTPTPTPKTYTEVHEGEQRASRLPAGFPDEQALRWCEQKRPDLRAADVGEKFRDYWLGVPGQRGRKLDWLATWRNFVRNERGPITSGSGSRTAIQAERERNLDLALGRTPRKPNAEVIDV